MDSREIKKAKPTPADIEAAARLRAIWKAKPRSERPTQEEIAKEWPEPISQGTISQYLSGSIPLNYLAVINFARALQIRPEAIRNDLPEQRARSEWPFEYLPRERFIALGEKERGMIEMALIKQIEDFETTAKSHVHEKPAGGRRLLQRR